MEEIEKDDPEAFQCMVEFLYLHNAVHHGRELILHAKVYSIGCTYSTPASKIAAVDRFRTAAKLDWEGGFLLGGATIIRGYNTLLVASHEMHQAVRTIEGLGH
ncbi:hypothetical protein BST61_g11453 [Cercospora zeina]